MTSERPLSIRVERSIYSIRGVKVMRIPHLAQLYEVETKAQVSIAIMRTFGRPRKPLRFIR